MDNLILDAGLQNTNEEIELELATKNTRFVNFIIDHILAYATIYFLTYAVVLSNPYIVESITGNPSSTKGWDYLFSYSGMFLYYFISEFLLKGRTIGKMITGTRAITTNFTYLTAGDVYQNDGGSWFFSFDKVPPQYQVVFCLNIDWFKIKTIVAWQYAVFEFG